MSPIYLVAPKIRDLRVSQEGDWLRSREEPWLRNWKTWVQILGLSLPSSGVSVEPSPFARRVQ